MALRQWVCAVGERAGLAEEGFDLRNSKWAEGATSIGNFIHIQGGHTMSMHPSLKLASKIRTRRNVLKRFERVELLKKLGRWSDGDKVLGLPKTKPED